MLTKIAYIKIFYNIDKENKDRAIRSFNSKAVYNGRKQISTVALSSYSAYPLNWIKFKDLCASCKKKYSFKDKI